MLTLPDFKEKKIVFVSHKGDLPNDLKFGNANIRLYKNGSFVDQISCHLVLSLFIIGETTISSGLVKNAQKFGISIFLLNSSLKTYAEIMSKAEGNYKLREIQYGADQKEILQVSKNIIKSKINNQIALANHYSKSFSEDNIGTQVDKAKDINSLLGIEGATASKYFSAIFSDLNWYRRAPRTKEDIPNLLLDIGYSFLFNYVDSILRLFGFDTYKGFYHQLFFQRQSLSCDVMEPFRPLIDRQLIKSYNLKQINEKDFAFQKGAFRFKKGIQKKYVDIWFRVIMKNKVDIYNYILQLYRHLLNPGKYDFPTYELPC